MANLDLLKKSQLYFTGTGLLDVHQCPDLRKEEVTVHFCNHTNAAVAVRLALALWNYGTNAADVDDPKQYQVYDLSVPANNIFRYSLTLNQKDTIRVKVGTINAISITINIDNSLPLAT